MDSVRREQISIDDFGNLIGRRSKVCYDLPATHHHASHVHHTTTSTVPLISTSSVSATQIQDELQEQLQWYRREMERKEKLIDDLSKTEAVAQVSYRTTTCETQPHSSCGAHSCQQSLCDSLVTQYRKNAEDAQCELVTSMSKIKTLEVDICDLQTKLTVKDAEFSALKSETDSLRDNNARQAGVINSMRSNVCILEQKASKVEIEYRSCNQKIEELQSVINGNRIEIGSLRDQLTEARSGAGDIQSQIAERDSRLREMYISVLTVMGERTSSWDAAIPDDIVALSQRVQRVVDERVSYHEENIQLKEQITEITESRTQLEFDVRAGRETIMRLVAENERKEKELNDRIQANDELIKAGEGSQSQVNSLEAEIDSLKSQLAESEDRYATLSAQFSDLSIKLTSYESQADNSQAAVNEANAAYEKLRENIAAMLSHSFQFVDKQDDSILIRVRELIEAYHNRKRQIELLEAQNLGLKQQMDAELSRVQHAGQRTVVAEHRVCDHNSRISELEEALRSRSCGSSGLQNERVQFLRFIEQLSVILKMDQITAEIGLDSNAEAVLSRVDQLMKKETDTLVEKGSTIYGLQRKCKTMKEELEGKELHLDMLRKKIAQLEEKTAGKFALNAEKEDTEVKLKKMTRLNERLRGQLGDAKLQMTELKAEVGEMNSVKLRQVEKDEEIRVLVERLDHSEKVRNKQAKQLAGLKQELNFSTYEAKSSTSSKEERIAHMMEDLSNTKRALEEIARRERQLVDFRSLVARMIGLDASVLTVPDYEIVSKLERLIQHHHVETTSHTCHPTEGDGMDKFWDGYEKSKTRHDSRKKKTTQSAW